MADLIKTPLDQAVVVLPLATRASGTFKVPIQVVGPAMYATVWFRSSAGGTLKVNWYETTTGVDGDERFDLDSHPLLSGPPQHSRIAVGRMQGPAVYLEAIVTGAPCEFGVMVKAVRDFPVEGSFVDGQEQNPALDKGSGLAVLDRDAQQWFFLSGSNGVIDVNVVDSAVGTGNGKTIVSTDGLVTDPNVDVSVLSGTVPGGKIWILKAVHVSARVYGQWRIREDGDRISPFLNTGPATENPYYIWYSGRTLTAGQEIDVVYLQTHGTSADLSGSLEYTEQNA